MCAGKIFVYVPQEATKMNATSQKPPPWHRECHADLKSRRRGILKALKA